MCVPTRGGVREAQGASLIVGDEGRPDQFTLWLGGVQDAIDLDSLRRRKVSAIVNMAVRASWQQKANQCAINSQYAPFLSPEDLCWSAAEFSQDWYRRGLAREDFRYLGLEAEDREDYPIWRTFDEVSAFLRLCRQENRVVFVHCLMGVNRSATAVAAYLMRDHAAEGGGAAAGLSYESAVALIQERRPCVFQNAGFLKQLSAYGREGAAVAASTTPPPTPAAAAPATAGENAAEELGADAASAAAAAAVPPPTVVMVKRGGGGARRKDSQKEVRRVASSLSLCSTASASSASSSASSASSRQRLSAAGGLGGGRQALERKLAALRCTGRRGGGLAPMQV